jgi:hypothetical protein
MKQGAADHSAGFRIISRNAEACGVLARDFDGVDADKNGSVSPDELAGASRHRMKRFRNKRRHVQHRDRGKRDRTAPSNE